MTNHENHNTTNQMDDTVWTNLTELVKSAECSKIDYVKLDGRKVKITDDKGLFYLQTTISRKSYDIRSDAVYSYRLSGICDLSELLIRSWQGLYGLTLYIEGDVMKKQRTANKLTVGERVSLRSLCTDEVWSDAVCVAPGSIICYSDSEEGLDLLNEDLENIVVEEELGFFHISSVSY